MCTEEQSPGESNDFKKYVKIQPLYKMNVDGVRQSGTWHEGEGGVTLLQGVTNFV